MSYAQSFFPFSVTFKLTIVYGKSKLGMNMMTKSGSDWDMKDTDRDILRLVWRWNPRGIRWCCGSNGKNLFLPSLSRESPTCFKQTMNLLQLNKLRVFKETQNLISKRINFIGTVTPHALIQAPEMCDILGYSADIWIFHPCWHLRWHLQEGGTTSDPQGLPGNHLHYQSPTQLVSQW